MRERHRQIATEQQEATIVRIVGLLLFLQMASVDAYAEARLAIQGQPYFDGLVQFHVIDDAAVGQVPLLALGLDPLLQPVSTGKGPYHIGTLLSVIALVPIPASGHLDIPLQLPAFDPGLVGLPIVSQALVAGQLTNPAIAPLDLPYFQQATTTTIDSPNPTVQGSFGYDVAAGDFDDDGHMDIAVSAAREDVGGVETAGRVYVLWGPDHTTSAILDTSTPRAFGFFGITVTAGDLNGDGVDDLLVGETAGSPPVHLPGLRLYNGGSSFPGTPTFIAGPGTGAQYSGYTYNVGLGDFDDDGDTDIAVSNNKATINGFTESGKIDIYLGPDYTVMIDVPNPEPEEGAAFGNTFIVADVNGDDIDDIVEGSQGDPVGGVDAIGSMHVVYGPDLAVSPTLPCPEPLGPFTRFGYAVAAADLDGDSFVDLVGTDNKDRAFVLWGPGFTSHQALHKPPALIPNPLGDSAFGRSVDVTDANLDGSPDLLIADPFHGEMGGCSFADSGSVFVVLGPFFATYYPATAGSPECAGHFAGSLALASLGRGSLMNLIAGEQWFDSAGVPNSGRINILQTQ